MSYFYMDSRGYKSGPHVCMVNAFFIDTSPQAWKGFLELWLNVEVLKKDKML